MRAAAENVGPRKGRNLCTACHGPNGISSVNPMWPTLAGQHEDYLEHSHLTRLIATAHASSDSGNGAPLAAWLSAMKTFEVAGSKYFASLEGLETTVED